MRERLVVLKRGEHVSPRIAELRRRERLENVLGLLAIFALVAACWIIGIGWPL